LPRTHDGAILPGTDGPDKFLAMLAPGEAVVPSRAVRQGWPGVLEWFRSMGVPGFEGGKPPAIATGNPALDAQLSSTSSWLEGLGNSLSEMGKWIAETFMGVFREIGRTLVDIAKAVFPDRVAALEGVWAEVERRFGELKNYLSGANDAIDDTTNTLNKANEVAEKTITVWDEVRAVISDWTKQLVSSVPGLKNAIEAYKTTTTSIDDGGKGLGIAAGITAAALELLTAHSKEFQEALGYVTEGLTMLIEPINALLRMLGPVGSGALAGAGVGYGAAALFGFNPVIGIIAGGLLGIFGGMAAENQRSVEAIAERINTTMEAWRQDLNQARYYELQRVDLQGYIRQLQTERETILREIAGTEAWGVWPWESGKYSQLQQMLAEVNAQIKELETEGAEALLDQIKGVLGVSIQDIQNDIESAFSAADLGEFHNSIETNLKRSIREAFITQGLESELMSGLFDQFGDQVRAALDDSQLTSGELAGLEEIIAQISEQGTILFEALDAVGLGLNDLNDAARAASSSLRNVPAGFKYALERYHAAEPMLIDQQSMANLRATIQDLGSSGGYVIDLRGSTFYGEGDFKAKIAKVMSELSRNNRSATTYAVRA